MTLDVFPPDAKFRGYHATRSRRELLGGHIRPGLHPAACEGLPGWPEIKDGRNVKRDKEGSGTDHKLPHEAALMPIPSCHEDEEDDVAVEIEAEPRQR